MKTLNDAKNLQINQKLTGSIAGKHIAIIMTTAMLAYPLLTSAITPRTAHADEGASGQQSMHRLYNPNSGEHFYTASDAERDHLVSVGWNSEGEGWVAPTAGDPVYRLYNANAGDHHYTTSSFERDNLVNAGWSYEGECWFSDPNKSVPVYRQYNPNAFACNHNYSTSQGEREWLVSFGWRDEGVGWYAIGEGSGNASSAVAAPVPQYTYETYFLNDSATYSRTSRAFYIKTGSPNLDASHVKLTQTSGSDENNYAHYTNVGEYNDIRYSNYGGRLCEKVDGGWLITLNLDDAGTYDVSIVEDSGATTGTIATITVLDSTKEREAWEDYMINKYTSPEMTPVEKMRKICSAIDNGPDSFRYLPNSGNKIMNLAKRPSSPFWVSRCWDSYVSPAELCNLMKKVGGFTDIKNHYGDAKRGTSEWYATHYLASGVYNGKEYYFQACPLTSTNTVKDIDYVDFSDPGQLYAVK